MKTNSKIRDMIYIALMAVVIALCSFLCVPAAVPFTMQTFAVFCALLLLGGKRGTLAVALYLLLGIVGLPVFSGFKAGLGALLGPTGGYLLGFLLSGLCILLSEKLFGDALRVFIPAMIVGLLLCYAFGTAWFVIVYTKANGAITIGKALALCVIPFLPFDAIKLALAVIVRQALRKYVPA